MIFVLAQREFKNLFLSPVAWSVLAILQFILGFLFLIQVEAFMKIQAKLIHLENSFGITDAIVLPLFSNAATIFLLIIPLLTMRSLCGERHQNTLVLLLSAPISHFEIIIGKYLAIVAFLCLMIGLMGLMPLSLLLAGTLDWGKFLANLLALGLLTAAFSAIGLYMSCISSHTAIAAITSFGCLLFLWLLDVSASVMTNASPVFRYLSPLRHFQNLQSGLINTSDISYFLLLSSLFIFLSVRRLDKERWQA